MTWQPVTLYSVYNSHVSVQAVLYYTTIWLLAVYRSLVIRHIVFSGLDQGDVDIIKVDVESVASQLGAKSPTLPQEEEKQILN